ncbi:MAG: effector-associated domain EAD1-containing protein [Nannocystaceae bacterium]
MNDPLRASYGAKDKSHVLLRWSDAGSQAPRGLLGLTDKPPGSHGPGERWWPSVGCGPVEDWWALWWTMPDPHAGRGGMVRSEVALWPLEEIGTVDDLRPVMESLGGGDSLKIPSAELVGATVEAILSPEVKRPILQDLDLWPGLVTALWARLWPEARRSFSGRVALSPPQGGESVSPPWLFCVPPTRAPQWSEHSTIKIAADASPLSRAARWFVGAEDPVFAEVLSGCEFTKELGRLRLIARAADRVDRLRESPSVRHALDLLRTVVVLAPASDAAHTLKREALVQLEGGLADASREDVLSLSNLDLEKLPVGTKLEEAVGAWTLRRVPELRADGAQELFDRLVPERAFGWWQRAVGQTLSLHLAAPTRQMAKSLLHWLGQPNLTLHLRAHLPSAEIVERSIVDAAESESLTPSELAHVRLQTVEREWPVLHAWAVMQSESPKAALRAQRDVFDSLAGLSFLCERLPGDVVVSSALENPEPWMLTLAARRTAREPGLLDLIDATQPAWRGLWTAHVIAGGVRWPTGRKRDGLGMALIDAALSGDEATQLILKLATELSEIALDHPRRALLWDALSADSREALQPLVAGVLIRRCDAGQSFPAVEPPLALTVLENVRRARCSARVFAALLGWGVGLDEAEMIRLMNDSRCAEWAPVAESVGRSVLNRRWSRAAEELYRRSAYCDELLVAAVFCQELLSRWQRHLLSWRGGRTAGDSDAILISRVADLGSSLVPDGLEDLWERAGGKRRKLKVDGSPENRWREAATLAHEGALDGGLMALVRELLSERPYNSELKELESVLTTKSRRRE